MKLEIGCGHHPTPGWMRADANPNTPNLDFCGSALGPMPWPDGTFESIRAVDILEHIPYRYTIQAMTEWARLLAPGGDLFIQVPDGPEIFKRYRNNPASLVVKEFADQPPLVSAAWRIMGGQDDGHYSLDGDDWRWNSHTALFDSGYVTWLVQKVGLRLVSITVNPFPNVQATATKL